MALNFKLGKKNEGDDDGVEKPASKKAAGFDLHTLKSKAGLGNKKRCFVLVIGDDGGILTLLGGGKVVRRLFAPSAEKEHIKPFIELLYEHEDVPIYVLCDMIDQSYVRHTLPPVSPLSINKLVKRRLDRDFAPEDIKGALSLGREKTGRKEWNFMLISLANSDALQQWMDPILEMPNRCMGIYLLPVEVQQFIQQLSQKLTASDQESDSEWKVLVAHDKVGGFRQVVLKDNQLIFTRLTQYSPDLPVEVTAGNIEQEVLNTIEYLRRLAYSESSGLDIYMILSQDLKDVVDIMKYGARRVNLFTPFEISQMMRLPQAALSGDRFSDVVISANFGVHQRPVLKLLPAYAKKLDLLYKGKFGARVVVALATVYMLYSAATATADWQATSSVVSDLEDQLAAAQSGLAKAQESFDTLGSDQNKVMRVASLYKATPLPKETPIDFVRNVAAIKSEKIRVLNWNWGTSLQTPARRSQPKNARNKNQPQDQPAQPKYQYNISLNIEVLEHEGDRRNMVRDATEFLDKLRKAYGNYKVTSSELPGTEKKENLVLDLTAPVQEVSYEMRPGEERVTINISGPNDITEDKS